MGCGAQDSPEATQAGELLRWPKVHGFQFPREGEFVNARNMYGEVRLNVIILGPTGNIVDNGAQRTGKLETKGEFMAKKRVFISFDYDNDEDAKIMLAGQAKLDDSPFDFKDASVKDHLAGDWKDKVRRRMDNVDVVIVLCGEKTHTAKGVAAELEIAQEKEKPYFHLAAYKDKTCTQPTSAQPGDKVYKWTWDNLKALIGGAR